MKLFTTIALGLALVMSKAAFGADAPLAMKAFKMNEEQMRRIEEMSRLQKQLRQIDGPYEREINAWFKDAAGKFAAAKEYSPDGSWAVDRRQLIKKLEDIEARKDPRIDSLRKQIDSIDLELLKSLKPEQMMPPSEAPIRRQQPANLQPLTKK